MLCVVSMAQAQETIYRDTVHLYSFKTQPDIRSGNVEGMNLNLQYRLVYDKDRHRTAKPLQLGIRVVFFHPDGRVISAVPGATNHASKERIAITGSEDFHWTGSRDLFMPYYALNLPPGTRPVRMKVYAYVKDTAVTEDPRIIFVTGASQTGVTITKPPVRIFRMIVREIRVSPRNAKGRPWDFGILKTNDPDLIYRISMNSKNHSDNRFASTTVDDAVSGSWSVDSGPVTISVADRITLGVYDKDAMFDDLIGRLTHPLDEWVRIGKSGKPVVFGLVTHCLIEAEEMTGDKKK